MFSFLVSTLGNRSKELHRLLKSIQAQREILKEVIIIAQDNYRTVREVVEMYKRKIHIQLIETSKKGLSFSRNLGLRYVTGDILVISDDDCWYPKNIFEKLRNKIEQNEITTFQIYDDVEKQYFRRYKQKERTHQSKLLAIRISSIEIVINLRKVDINHIVFDEEFGLGSTYASTEENNLIIDLINKGYHVTYVPNILTYHSVLSNKLDSELMDAKGAFFRRNFNFMAGMILCFLFYLKKIKKIKHKYMALNKLYTGFFTYSR